MKKTYSRIIGFLIYYNLQRCELKYPHCRRRDIQDTEVETTISRGLCALLQRPQTFLKSSSREMFSVLLASKVLIKDCILVANVKVRKTEYNFTLSTTRSECKVHQSVIRNLIFRVANGVVYFRTFTMHRICN